MTAVTHVSVAGHAALTSGIKTLQTYLSKPVSVAIDEQSLGAEIIKLQTYLSTVAAGGQPSGKKFDPVKINKYIDREALGARLIEIEKAADLT